MLSRIEIFSLSGGGEGERRAGPGRGGRGFGGAGEGETDGFGEAAGRGVAGDVRGAPAAGQAVDEQQAPPVLAERVGQAVEKFVRDGLGRPAGCLAEPDESIADGPQTGEGIDDLAPDRRATGHDDPQLVRPMPMHLGVRGQLGHRDLSVAAKVAADSGVAEAFP